jgi:serine-type D-Ala-D-Ala carboxypeptidase
MNLEELKAKPNALGMDGERLKLIDALIEKGIKDRWFPAATYVVMRHGMIAAQKAFGFAQPDANPPLPTTMETIFDMASVTKPTTATLLLQCVEEGRLHLGQKVGDVLKEAAKAPVSGATLRQLATHTSGLPAWKALYKTTAPSALEDILTTTLAAEPGTRYTYSDLGYILLGVILERVTGKPLDRLAKERLFAPLGMTRTGFRPDPSLHPMIAATANCPMREGQKLVGEVHDANAHSLKGIAGHAGVFSNAPDMVRFALALQRGPMAAHLNLPRILGPAARKLAQESQIPAHIGGHSIGWFCPPSGYLPRGDLFSEKSFGHTGFTGTLLMFDPQNDLILILLTNRVYSPGDGSGVLTLRRLVANVVAGAIMD